MTIVLVWKFLTGCLDQYDDRKKGRDMSKLDVSAGGATAADACGNIIQDLSQSALSSMEQFISPIQIRKGHTSATPGFRRPNPLDEDGFFGGGAVGPTLDELDPYFPIGIIDGDDGSQFMKQNDYRIVANDSVYGDGDFNIRKIEDFGGDRANISQVQPMNALRGPLIVSGWGFGMDDFPVPNKSSDYPNNRQFDQEMASDRAKWKTGPVHLMWDDERQVWQGGYHIVCGVVQGAITAPSDVCTPTSFEVNLLRNNNNAGGILSDESPNGAPESITVTNRDPSLEQDAVPNAIFCMAIKLNYEWLPLWVGCPEEPACDDETPPCVTFPEPCPEGGVTLPRL